MSLVLDCDHKNAIVVGIVKDKDGDKHVISYRNDVSKEKRVKRLDFTDVPGTIIKSVPFLDNRFNGRSASYISGISGSGKSTLAVYLARQLRKLRKDKKAEREVLIFTTSIVSKDPAFERLANAQFVSMSDPDFLSMEITDLEDKIIIFDDHENISDKRLRVHCTNFIKDVLERTRKLGVDIIIINHVTQNYAQTRGIIFECDTYYLNISMNRTAAYRFMTAYMNVGPKLIRRLVDKEYEHPFTFVAMHKSAPGYIIAEDEIMLV